jgi:DNA-binding NtrC family response regulator
MLGSQYKVETAASAEQALVMMGEKRYSLVITDYEMPGKDGLWLLRQARNRYPMMRRGLISGNNRKLISAHLRSGLVDFFLPKPAAYDELVALIARPTCKAALQQLHG